MIKNNSFDFLLNGEIPSIKYNNDVQYITKIKGLEAIEKEYGKLKNYDVVLTQERRHHIIERRKSDASFVLNNIKDTSNDYDYIYKDNDKIAIFIKHIDNDFYNYLVVYLSYLDKCKANSIITGIKMNKSKLLKKIREK